MNVKNFFLKNNRILILLITFALSSCREKSAINQTVIDSKADCEILFGYCNREGLESKQFGGWFRKEYAEYELKTAVLNQQVAQKLQSIEIVIVLGTWCSDSRREVPRMYKILDKLNFQEKNVKLICVNSLKLAQGIDIQPLNIERVPTFIFYSNQKEIGRIIETPEKSLEEDIADILLANN